jgi:flagellar hook assembly protein FlgD
VSLAVYDVNGHFVATLLDENRDAGQHAARWDGRDARGRASSSGVYFVRLEANGSTETRKMVLLK